MATALSYPVISGVSNPPYLSALSETANIQNTINFLYYGSTDGGTTPRTSLSTSDGIYGMLSQLQSQITAVQAGINVHESAKWATATTLAAVYADGPLPVDASGGRGVGAKITFSATGVQKIDSTTTDLALNDRVLVKDGVTADVGTSSKANGIYYVSTAPAIGVAGVLTRALDSDNSIAGEMAEGDFLYVTNGDTNANEAYMLTTTSATGTGPAGSIKIGTDAVTYTQFIGVGSYYVGTTPVQIASAAQVLTGISLSDSTSYFVDNADNTKRVNLDVTGTTGITGILQTAFTTAKTLIFPDASDTLVARTTTDTLTNKTLTTPIIDVVNASSATATTPSLYANTTSGTITIGALIGSTAANGTLNIANNAGIASGTKTINLGTSATAGTTTITIGSATGSTTNILGTAQVGGNSILTSASLASSLTSFGSNATLTTPTIDVINASSSASVTSSLFNNVTTGNVGVGTNVTTGNVNIGTSVTSGVIRVGTGTALTGDGSTTGLILIGSGANTATTKTITIGNAGTGGTTNINLGTSGAAGTQTVNTYGTFKIGGTTTIASGVTGIITLPSTAGTLALLGANTFTGTQTLVTGTTTVAPLRIPQSTQANLLTSPLANAIESSVEGFYATVSATPGRGIVRAPQMIVNTANSSSSGSGFSISVFGKALTLEANKIYRFRGVYYPVLTYGGASSTININFLFSNATQYIKYNYLTHSGGPTTSVVAIGFSTVETAVNVGSVILGSVSYAVTVEGTFATNATTGGTFTPQFNTSGTGSTTVMSAGTWLEIEKIGAYAAAAGTIIAGTWA